MNVLIPESEGLPPFGAMYFEWDIPDDKDRQGWYLCHVHVIATETDHQADSQAYISYPNGQPELLCLKSTKWYFVGKANHENKMHEYLSTKGRYRSSGNFRR